MINQFLDWAQQQQNGTSLSVHDMDLKLTCVCGLVWIVSSEQLLAWVQNPTPISNLNDFGPLKCSTPAVDPSMKICNGIPQNEAGLVELCPFSDFPFYTCYGCPSDPPTPSNPSPAQSSASAAPRFRSK